MKNNAIILLSGGLDSVVALAYIQKKTNTDIKLAITFDYGQKTVFAEIDASKKIAEYYNVEHRVIKLDWLKDITNTALVKDNASIVSNSKKNTVVESLWVPNRNSMFLNIAACFCDALKYDTIIYGANKDEADNFPDNTELFRNQINKTFESSTLVKPKVIAPLINCSKSDIVRIAIEESVPLELIKSCYFSGELHCGQCESCRHLKNALKENHCERYLKILFKDDEN